MKLQAFISYSVEWLREASRRDWAPKAAAFIPGLCVGPKFVAWLVMSVTSVENWRSAWQGNPIQAQAIA